MADEWIKARVGLRRHPKVVRIVSALRSDRLRVVGALIAVWSVFDEHSVDGHLPGYSFEMMDEEIGWPGFSEAMHGVEWLDRDGDCGLVMPDFSTHNGLSAKRRATDAQRKKASREAPQSVRNLSANGHGGNVTRGEEIRKEEKHTRGQGRAGVDPVDNIVLPDWLPRDAWTQFVNMRIKLKKPLSSDSANLILEELAKLGQQGENLTDVLLQSVRNDWPDVYPKTRKTQGKSSAEDWTRSDVTVMAKAKEVGVSTSGKKTAPLIAEIRQAIASQEDRARA